MKTVMSKSYHNIQNIALCTNFIYVVLIAEVNATLRLYQGLNKLYKEEVS